jgi:hypothetical protein
VGLFNYRVCEYSTLVETSDEPDTVGGVVVFPGGTPRVADVGVFQFRSKGDKGMVKGVKLLSSILVPEGRIETSPG